MEGRPDRQRPLPRRRHQLDRHHLRARQQLGLDLDEAARRPRDGTRHGGDDTPDAAARRRAERRPGGGVRQVGRRPRPPRCSRARRRPHASLPRRWRRRCRRRHGREPRAHPELSSDPQHPLVAAAAASTSAAPGRRTTAKEDQ
ncbi:hypothetical protein PSCLAVI8L_140061 [Pseudoclavibacter sp. 8L]|nr:hypothetical protein PSCLAVI8L_140061 [Pseudoclavibacter sp. 8L]